MTSDGDWPWRETARRLILATAVPGLLADRGRALVLEQVAGGGGTTNWYRLGGSDALDGFIELVGPGSLVTFYFDGRLSIGAFDARAADEARPIYSESRDGVVGHFAADSHRLEVKDSSSFDEIEEFAGRMGNGTTAFWGRFPAADSDGERAVTLVIPDRDGVVRAHPYS